MPFVNAYCKKNLVKYPVPYLGRGFLGIGRRAEENKVSQKRKKAYKD